MSDILIIYAREDLAQARDLARALEAHGWSVFWDRTIPSGKTWRSFVGKALEEARCVLVTWSTAAINSHWVQEEAEDGRHRNILIPILLEKVRPPIGFRSIEAADLVGWDGSEMDEAFKRLVRDIAALIGPAPKIEEERLQPVEVKDKRNPEEVEKPLRPGGSFRDGPVSRWW